MARCCSTPTGRYLILAVAPAIAVGLEEAGYDVRVVPAQVDGYGEHRTEPPDEGASEVWVRSAVDSFEEGTGEGEVVAALQLTGEENSWGDHLIEVRVRLGSDETATAADAGGSVDLAVAALPVGGAELELLELAGGGAGQLVAELDALGHL